MVPTLGSFSGVPPSGTVISSTEKGLTESATYSMYEREYPI